MGWWGRGGFCSTTAWGGGLLFKPCWWRGTTTGFVSWYPCWTVSYSVYFCFRFILLIFSSKRKDYRTRRDRIERQVQAWKSVLPHLVTAFLEFQQRGAPAVNEDANPWGIEVISLEGPFKFPFPDRHWHFDRPGYTVLFTYAQRSVFCHHPCRIWGDTSITRTAETWIFHWNTSFLPTATACISSL